MQWCHFFLGVSKDTGQFVDDKENWEEKEKAFTERLRLFDS